MSETTCPVYEELITGQISSAVGGCVAVGTCVGGMEVGTTGILDFRVLVAVACIFVGVTNARSVTVGKAALVREAVIVTFMSVGLSVKVGNGVAVTVAVSVRVAVNTMGVFVGTGLGLGTERSVASMYMPLAVASASAVWTTAVESPPTSMLGIAMGALTGVKEQARTANRMKAEKGRMRLMIQSPVQK
jgi:hypothetical protein